MHFATASNWMCPLTIDQKRMLERSVGAYHNGPTEKVRQTSFLLSHILWRHPHVDGILSYFQFSHTTAAIVKNAFFRPRKDLTKRELSPGKSELVSR